MAGMAENKGESLASTGAKNFARDLGSLCTADTEQEAALKRFKQERIENDDTDRKAKGHAGTECVVNTRTATAELDSCLPVAEGMWWEDDDLCLAHTDEDWGQNQPDDTWYTEEVNHMT